MSFWGTSTGFAARGDQDEIGTSSPKEAHLFGAAAGRVRGDASLLPLRLDAGETGRRDRHQAGVPSPALGVRTIDDRLLGMRRQGVERLPLDSRPAVAIEPGLHAPDPPRVRHGPAGPGTEGPKGDRPAPGCTRVVRTAGLRDS